MEAEWRPCYTEVMLLMLYIPVSGSL